MKKIALAIGCWLIVLAVLVFPMYAWLNSSAEPVYDYETITETQPRVYVTNYGDKYHNGSCHYLHSSKIAKGRTQAYDEGYTACSYCGGKSSGTIEVTYKKRIEKDPTTRNVWGAIGLAACIGFIPGILLFGWIDEKFLVEESSSVHNTPSAPPQPPSEKEKRETAIATLKGYPIERIKGIIGRRVYHSTYGEGIIGDIDRDYITVVFDEGSISKKFQYPQAFVDKFLTFVDN